MSPSSRRTFLKHVSAAAAAGLFGQIPGQRLWAVTVDELLAEPDEALLRKLALAAVEAARSAGGTFADVRVAAGRGINVRCGANWQRGQGPAMRRPALTLRAEYGIRAIVDGVWGFAGGSEMTPDAVARAAQVAVARARANRPRRPRTLDLAPAPQAEGTWATPIEQDPFRVPVGEQADIALAALREAGKVPGLTDATVEFGWARNIRVFASSEGSLTVQRLSLARPEAAAGVGRTPENDMWARERVDAFRPGGFGYEALTRVDLKEELRKVAERAVAEARKPHPPSVDVGRYDLVFGGNAMATILAATVAKALNLERVLGYHANGAGTSFAAPPADVLGHYKLGSPLLNVQADRTQLHGASTVGWDDEGIPAREYALIRDGILVDYLSTRQTAAELSAWYRSRGEPVRSGGCASGAGQQVPDVDMPNLTMQPGKDGVSVEDLISDTKNGFYIERDLGVSSDQQVLNTQGWTRHRWVREIRDGKLGDRVQHLAFQTITPAFWQSIDGIGGPGAVVETLQGTRLQGAGPLQVPYATVKAAPARARDVNVLNYGRMS